MWGQGFRARMLAAGEFFLGVGDLLQRLVPLSLQSPGDQAVVGVDSPVAALSPACLVAGLLGLAPPLRERGVVAVLKLLGAARHARSAAGCRAARNAPATAASIATPPTRR